MKKIAIILYGASVGGIETSLINMLNNINLDICDVTLFTNLEGNPCIDKISSKIEIIDVNCITLKNYIYSETKAFNLANVTRGLIVYIRSRLAKNDAKKVEIISKLLKLSDRKYDCVIAYKQDYLTTAAGILMIDAAKRILWLHGPIWKENNPEKEYVKWISSYDRIYGVSKDVIDEFLIHLPSQKDKTDVFLNLLDVKTIRAKALLEPKNTISEEKCRYKLLSVGRYNYAKNFDNVPEICSYLVQNGFDVKWFLIGYGEDEAIIHQNIERWKMEDHVIMIGKKDNPYPYMKSCDVYVQPSRYEGRCVAVIEAQVLNKPVVITDYPTAKAQFDNGKDGIIVSMDNKECALSIGDLLRNGELQKQLIHNTKMSDYSNFAEIQKLYEILEIEQYE